jgi:hypothetical protein
MSMVEIDFIVAPLGKDCLYAVNGVNISKAVRGVSVHADVGSVTTVIVEYVCRSGVTNVKGTVKAEEIEHVCPVYDVLALAYADDGDTATWMPFAETFVDRGGVRRAHGRVQPGGTIPYEKIGDAP